MQLNNSHTNTKSQECDHIASWLLFVQNIIILNSNHEIKNIAKLSISTILRYLSSHKVSNAGDRNRTGTGV